MRNKIKRILAAVMAAGMTLSVIPSITTYAAQSNEYVYPADISIEANGRTSEFDINATVTTGTEILLPRLRYADKQHFLPRTRIHTNWRNRI